MAQGNIGLDLWDEGFFWYGAQRVTFGEVPIRDYMAYDVGRYYWSGAFLWLSGDLGIISLRYSVVFLQIIAVFIFVYSIQKHKQPSGFVFNFTAAIIVVLWMYPYFKSFDHFAALLIVSGLILALKTKSTHGFFKCGVLVGLSALIGRNHGLYGLLAAAIALGYVFNALRNLKYVIKLAVYFCAGLFISYLPMIFVLLFVDGFAHAYWTHAIKFHFEIKGTSIPLPVPWPWRISPQGMQWDKLMEAVSLGVWYLILPALTILGFVGAFFTNRVTAFRSPIFLGGVFASLPYMHYAFSRPELFHLSVGVIPLLVALFGFAARQPRFSCVTLIVSLSLLTASVLLPVQWGYAAFRDGKFEKIKVGKDQVLLDSGTISQLRMVNDLVFRFAPEGQSFLAVPFLPGTYPIFERKAPLWEIYGLFPRSKEFQDSEIQRIEKAKPNFAIVWDFPIDGRDELRFKNTHPLIQKYIEDSFDRHVDLSASKEFDLFKSRGNASHE